MTVASNIDEVITLIQDRLSSIDISEMTALQASSVIGEMRKRIHVDGKDSSGGDIGNYSAGYLKVRSGLYGAAKVNKKGVTTSAGVFTKGKNKGNARPKYNRDSSPKVVLSLTRQMEGDMIIIPIENGHAIGYSNLENFKKSQYAEANYRKTIFHLTKEEREIVYKTGRNYINNDTDDNK